MTGGHDYTLFYEVFFAGKGSKANGNKPRLDAVDNVISIVTQKSIGDPAGAFEITLDGTHIEGNARWRELIVPNDYVEIRIGVQPRYPEVRVVLRGWVDNVRLVESGEGQGSRRIIISGRDYGKIWLVVKLLNIYPPFTEATALLLNFYHFSEDSLIDVPLTRFFLAVMEKILQPYVEFQKKRIPSGPDGVKSFVATSEIQDFLHLANTQSSSALDIIFNYLKTYQNSPWIEMFVRDDDDAPRFYLRWARLRTSENKLIDPFDNPLPPDRHHQMDETDDVIVTNLGGTDNEVFNWFYTANSAFGNVDQDVSAFYDPGVNPYVAGDSIDLYGLRKMNANTTFTPTAEGDTEVGLNNAVAKHRDLTGPLNLWLVKMYSYTYLLENGTASSLGWPDFRVGEELYIPDTDMQYYIEGVQHNYIHNETYTMSLTLTRGMNYNNGTGLGASPFKISPYAMPQSYGDITPIVGSEFARGHTFTTDGSFSPQP